jgi:hypothetical protein
MLNDVGMPPEENPDQPPHHGRAIHASGHIAPTVVRTEIGRHHTRHMGEPTRTDPMFAMPFEERGSSFNVTMSIVAVSLFAVLILMAWWTLGYK